MRSNVRRFSIVAAAACTAVSRFALAQQVSEPATLQWFEATQRTIEKRTPDLFAAGYGSVWLPPQFRSDDFTSVGYNVYDRFDLGKAGDPTLYGTETGLKGAIGSMHRAGGSKVFLDYILNHAGLRSNSTMDGAVRFAPNPSNPAQAHAGGYPGFVMGTTTLPDGDFHPANVGTPGTNPQYDYQYRLSGLLDIDQRTSLSYIRNPVPGFANNHPFPANATAFGRRANVPDENNRRFYPDQATGGTALTDPRTGGAYTLYNFNNATPLAGDPVPDNAMGYLMRNAQWLIQNIGADGYRLDAVKHVYPFVLDYYDRAVFRADQRLNLDGSSRNVFAFGEYYDGNGDLVDNVIRKDISSQTTVGGNRDALDFPLFFALRDRLTSTAGNNNWHGIRHASVDVRDDGNANNGSQGVAFVRSHDDTGAYLDTVAHAFTLLRPGRAIVYTNAKEFGTGRSFPRDGRNDALGGFYGDAITKLVEIRNTHGRGNFAERWVDDAFNPNGFSNVYVYERQNSCVVALNSNFGTLVDVRTPVQTSFAPGTHLVELTGNAADPTIDVNGTVPETLVVNGSGQITISIPRNTTNVNKGYVIYGLQNPQGAMSLTNVASTLAGGTQNAANFGTVLLSSVDVITANSFTVNLNTNAVTLPDNFRDLSADGDRAYVRLDDGIDVNASGTVDFRTPGSTRYGFENFSVSNPGFNQPSGNGSFSQSIDTTNLSEGYHYITSRAFRQRSDGGPDVYSDFKRTIYVDRLKPVSAVNDFAGVGSMTAQTRDLSIKSIDQTATQVNVFVDLAANLTDSQILGLVSGTNQAAQIDRDVFSKQYFSVGHGNHAVTIVTREITGNTSIQRIPGVFTQTTRGAGLGDLNFDGSYGSTDVTSMETLVYPNGSGSTNFAFNAAADMNADGLMDSRDLYGQRDRFIAISAPAAATNASITAVLERGDLTTNHTSPANADDIDFLYASFGNTQWKFDLDVDGWPTPSGADQQDVDVLVRTIFQTEYGDADLNGSIDFDDYVMTDGGYNGGFGGWANGDFDGNGGVDFDDYVILDLGFNSQGARLRAQRYLSGDDRSDLGMDEPGLRMVQQHFDQFGVPYARAFIAAVPEPGAVILIGVPASAGMLLRRARRVRETNRTPRGATLRR